MGKITQILAREILDSRGNPTLEVDVTLSSGSLGRFAVPSGASTGEHEALELRDGDKRRYRGKGVLKAVANVNQLIAEALLGMDATNQKQIDDRMCAMDGTVNKSLLGANAILGVSVACAKAAASVKKLPLFMSLGGDDARVMPVPMMNVVNGGAHADNDLDVQEFMIMPVGAANFREALRFGAEVFYALKDLLKSKGLSTNVGDEGGFAPNLRANREALDLLSQAVEKAGFRLSTDVCFALDVAASECYDKQKQVYSLEKKTFSSEEMVDVWTKLCADYPIESLEDAMDENDWLGWQMLTKKLGKKVQLVGDDLFVTNSQMLRKGIDMHVANAVLIKLNQIGTLSETLETVKSAHQANYKTIISHRSGETEDATIADLAVAWSSGQIKTGSLSRSDRTGKYNQLLRIEEILGSSAQFLGREIFKR